MLKRRFRAPYCAISGLLRNVAGIGRARVGQKDLILGERERRADNLEKNPDEWLKR